MNDGSRLAWLPDARTDPRKDVAELVPGGSLVPAAAAPAPAAGLLVQNNTVAASVRPKAKPKSMRTSASWCDSMVPFG
jgi:hypothetical protein